MTQIFFMLTFLYNLQLVSNYFSNNFQYSIANVYRSICIILIETFQDIIDVTIYTIEVICLATNILFLLLERKLQYGWGPEIVNNIIHYVCFPCSQDLTSFPHMLVHTSLFDISFFNFSIVDRNCNQYRGLIYFVILRLSSQFKQYIFLFF